MPFYSIERINVSLNEPFEDGEHILYVNGAYRGDDEIGKLMHDFSCSNPDDMIDGDMAEVARYYKENEEGVEAMCKAMEEMRNETELRKAREIALTLIQLGDYSFEKIAEITNLSFEEVKQLSEGKTA